MSSTCKPVSIADNPTLAEQATTLIAKFMGPSWDSSGADTAQVGPMLAPWPFAFCEVINWTNEDQILRRHTVSVGITDLIGITWSNPDYVHNFDQ